MSMQDKKEYKINYIVAFYIGTNRNNIAYNTKIEDDPLYFVNKHYNFLSTCNSTHITEATFIVNNDVSKEIKNQLLNLKLTNIKLKIFFRNNINYSYGGWNDVIKKNVNKFDYFFMIEDDYIPTVTDFYKAFVEKTSFEKPYIACKVETHPTMHPSFSVGIIRSENCKLIIKKNKDLFNLAGNTKESPDDAGQRFINQNRGNKNLNYVEDIEISALYINAVFIQMHFLDFLLESFSIGDITETHISVFRNYYENQTKIYGRGAVVIEPILIE